MAHSDKVEEPVQRKGHLRRFTSLGDRVATAELVLRQCGIATCLRCRGTFDHSSAPQSARFVERFINQVGDLEHFLFFMPRVVTAGVPTRMPPGLKIG